MKISQCNNIACTRFFCKVYAMPNHLDFQLLTFDKTGVTAVTLPHLRGGAILSLRWSVHVTAVACAYREIRQGRRTRIFTHKWLNFTRISRISQITHAIACVCRPAANTRQSRQARAKRRAFCEICEIRVRIIVWFHDDKKMESSWIFLVRLPWEIRIYSQDALA